LKIFDAHAHIGYDVSFDVEASEGDLLSVYAEHGIYGALIQPFIPRPYIDDTRAVHDRIFAFTQAHPGKFFGMISLNPHLYPQTVRDECARCVRDLGFKGVKIATTAYGVSPSGADGLRIFEIAAELGIAVMVHTGGGNFGAPSLLEKPARLFPETPVVIAHGGGEDGVAECIRLAKAHENVYVEPSWINLLSMEKFAREIGADKIMYSSDMPQNTPAQLAIFNAVFKTPEEREKVFAKTAAKAFSFNL